MQGVGYMYPWRTQLCERHCEVTTMRIGLFSNNSHENQE